MAKAHAIPAEQLKVGDRIISSFHLPYTVEEIQIKDVRVTLKLRGKLPWNPTIYKHSPVLKVQT